MNWNRSSYVESEPTVRVGASSATETPAVWGIAVWGIAVWGIFVIGRFSSLAAADELPENAIRRLGTTRYRHGTSIASFGMSADGKVAAASSGNHYLGSTWAYDLETGTTRYELKLGHDSTIAVAPNGKYLATKVDTKLAIRDSKDGGTVFEVGLIATNPRSVTHWVSWSANSNLVATTGSGLVVEVVDVDKQQVVAKLEHEKVIFSAAISPDGTLIATGGYNEHDKGYAVDLWSISGEKVKSLSYPRGIRNLAFSPNGKLLAVAGDAGVLRVWNWDSEERLLNTLPDGRRTRSAVFSPDSKRVAVSGDNVRIYDIETSEAIISLPIRGVTGLHFKQDNSELVGVANGTIFRWDAQTGKHLTSDEAPRSSVDQLLASENGRRVFVQDESGRVTIWDGKNGDYLGLIEVDSYHGIAVHPSGRLLAFATSDDKVKYRDPPDSNRIHTGSQVRIYDVAKKVFLEPFPSFEGEAHGVSFNAEGTRLTTVDNRTGKVRFWDMAERKLTGEISVLREGEEKAFYPVTKSVVSPDGRMIAIAYNDLDRAGRFGTVVKIRLWDVATGKELHEIAEHIQRIDDIAFSPGGRFVVSSSTSMRNAATLVHDVTTGERVKELPDSFPAQAVCLAISPDGQTLATATKAGLIEVWNTEGWTKITQFQGHRQHVNALYFADDLVLLSGGGDCQVLYWQLPPR